MKLQREVNGILFTINFPVEEILQKIEENKEYWKEYYDELVEGNHEAKSPEDVQKDIDKLIEAVHIYSTEEGRINQLFRLLPLKKNKKLSKSSKPTLHIMTCGVYLEDHYGWSTPVLRMKAIDELNAKIYLDSIIIHY